MEHRAANRPWHVLVNVAAASPLLTEERRVRLYRRGGIDLAGTSIRPGCYFLSDQVTFGTGGMINHNCYFESREPISIGSRVFLGPQVMLATSTHEIGHDRQRAGAYRGASLSIGDGAWIGARAVVLPGVSVGAGCIIASGAVVTRSTDPHGLYGGVPARRIRDL